MTPGAPGGNSPSYTPPMKYLNRRALLAGGFAALLLGLSAPEWLARLHGQAEPFAQRSARMSADADARGLAEPFRGLSTNGALTAGLFTVRSTGVSTEPVRKAADAFLATLAPAQRARTTFNVDDDEWRKWMNQHFYLRQGVSFEEMSAAQRDAGFALMAAALSARGLKQTRDIMRLNHTLGELNSNDFEQYGEWRYHLTVMGTPSAGEPWGWQFDGHHAVINYFVLGDQVVMTPFFAGSEPVIARTGKFAGTAVLQEEQNRGLAFVNGLSAASRAAAVQQAAKIGNNNLTEAWRDNADISRAGLQASGMTAQERERLVDLIALYVENMSEGQARVRLDEVRAHLNDTWFTWIGGTAPDSVFYYRIHSPVILIEFDHQNPANLRHLATAPGPNREHIHVVVRTPNGNDYGKDLLRQHYAMHPHPRS
jgi:hypothetical protein